MTDKESPQSKKLKNFDAIDPLGEIRRAAKDLWKQAGAPMDKDWTDYFDEAEQLLVGGVGGRGKQKDK